MVSLHVAWLAIILFRERITKAQLIILICAFVVSMQQRVNEYDQEIPQSYTADQPTAP